MRWLYQAWYRWGTPPWVGGPRAELVELVGDGSLQPGRALDIGCGTGANAIHLAQHGFDVTGIDFASSAIDRARKAATDAGADVTFVVGDVTAMPEVEGPFDLIVDYGTFDDLKEAQRPACVAELVRLSLPGTRVLLWCFEHEPGWGSRLATRMLGGSGALVPGEVEDSFGQWFEVMRHAGGTGRARWPSGWAAYVMKARGSSS